jgi:mevalonate kinase
MRRWTGSDQNRTGLGPMSAENNSFPAKVLLFGEYTILLGSTALSIPYPVFSATLMFSPDEEPLSSRKQLTSNHHLFEFYQYLAGLGDPVSQAIDFERFHQDLVKGLFLQSTIPPGYGLGSSGALVAAVFDRFGNYVPSQDEIANGEGMLRLKKIFSEMESFFHGKSSGFDPLVSFLKQPLFLRSDGLVELTNLPQAFTSHGSGIFLLDTGQTGKTAPLVKFFMERFKPEGQIIEEGKALINMIDQLVNSFLDFSDYQFWTLMKKFSQKQREEFKPMIPVNFISLWAEGIENGLFYFKLCGSGGGGFLIGFARDINAAVSFLLSKDYRPVVVPITGG